MTELFRVVLFALLAIVFAAADVTLRVMHTGSVHGFVNGRSHNPTYDATLADYRAFLDLETERGKNMGYTVLSFDSGNFTRGTGYSDGTDIPGKSIFELYSMLDLTAYNLGTAELSSTPVLEWLAEERSKTIDHRFTNLLSTDTEYYGGSDFPYNGPLGEGSRFFTIPNSDLKVAVFGFPDPRGESYIAPGVHFKDPSVSISNQASYIETECPGLVFFLIDQSLMEGSNQPIEQRDALTALRETGFCGKNATVVFLSGRSSWRYIDHCTSSKGQDDLCIGIESASHFGHISQMDISLVKTIESDNGKDRQVWRWFNDTPPARNFGPYGIAGTKKDLAEALSIDKSELFSNEGDRISDKILDIAHSNGLNDIVGCSQKRMWHNNFYALNYSLEFFMLQDVFSEIMLPVYQEKGLGGNCEGGARQTPLFLTQRYPFRADLYAGKVTRDDLYTAIQYNEGVIAYECIPGKLIKEFLKYNNNGLEVYDVNNTLYNPLWLPSVIPALIEDNTLYFFCFTDYIDQHWIHGSGSGNRVLWAADRAGVPRSSIKAHVKLPEPKTGSAMINYVEKFMRCDGQTPNSDDDDGEKKEDTNKKTPDSSHWGFWTSLFVIIVVIMAILAVIDVIMRWRVGHGIPFGEMWHSFTGMGQNRNTFRSLR